MAPACPPSPRLGSFPPCSCFPGSLPRARPCTGLGPCTGPKASEPGPSVIALVNEVPIRVHNTKILSCGVWVPWRWAGSKRARGDTFQSSAASHMGHVSQELVQTPRTYFTQREAKIVRGGPRLLSAEKAPVRTKSGRT